MKTKKDMPVGKKVRGYGLLNEFGEFDFIPEETGSRKGVVRVVVEKPYFSISTTKTKVLIHQRIPRSKGLSLAVEFMKNVNEILSTLREYDI